MAVRSCKDLIRVLDDYLAGTLRPAARRAFEGHLAICPYCRDYLKTYGEAVRLGKTALIRSVMVPPMPERLVRAIVAARRAGRSAPRTLRRRRASR